MPYACPRTNEHFQVALAQGLRQQETPRGMEQQQDQLCPVEERTLHKPLGVCVNQKEFLDVFDEQDQRFHRYAAYLQHSSFFQARPVNRLGYRSNTLFSTDIALHLKSKESLTL